MSTGELGSLRVRRHWGKRYYRAEDVERLLERTREELEQGRGALRRMDALERAAADCDALRAEREQAARELEELREALALREKELTGLGEELERVRRREAFLSADAERRKKELEEYARFAASDPVVSAQEQAHKLLADAQTERERLMQEYASQRARVMAATRAAYYNAQQFKLELSRRFGAMERELDETIDVLRVLESAPETARLEAREAPAQPEDGE